MTIEVRLLEWNAEAILAKVPKVLEKVGAELGEEARSQITNIKWDWPNPTLRFKSSLMGGTTTPGKPGVLVQAGKRDIVDTGRLLASQTDLIVDGNSVAIRWDVPYASLILSGGDFPTYTNPRGVQVTPKDRPKRNWITATFAAKPVLPLFVRYWAETPAQR